MRVILHAPTANALQRARSNARNLRLRQPDAEIVIIVNADGVPAALETPEAETDDLLRICANTLAARKLSAPRNINAIPAAVEMIVQLQTEGWIYIRA
jgi:intracellular sulfur oxidation DsrE/DsrF family protein